MQARPDRMNKKISLGAAVAFMVVVAGITLCITMMVSLNYFNKKVLNVKNREEMYKKISDVDRNARQNFYGPINEEALLDSVSAGFIRGLGDKYSTYLSKDEYEQRLKELSGKEVGIGVTVSNDESGYLRVKKVLEESPAKLSGIMVDDYIISINDVDLKTISFEESAKLMNGAIGTKLKIVYRRNGVDTPIDVIRKDLQIKYVEWKMIDKNGYIKILDFNDLTYNQFKDAVDNAVRQGATGLIFDIRNNGGGTLKSVTAILNLLLPSGDIGTKIDNNGVTSVLDTSDKYEISLPMVTLINGKTASASELFAAALRDFKKSSLVGTLTYGKGVMQSLIKLTDGSAINVTTAHFFPPSGEPINGVGIKPEYEVKLTPEQEQRLDELDPAEDMQLQKAIEVVNSNKSS